MAFDPDAYLKKKAGEAPAGGFDPDAYLSKKKAPTGMGDLKLAESQAGPPKASIAQNIFPTASQPLANYSARTAGPIPGTQSPYPMTYAGNAPGVDMASRAARTAGLGAMDLMGLGTRGVAAALTDQRMSDPGAYALRGPAEKAAQRQRTEIEGGRAGLMAERNPQNDLARMQMVNPAGTPPGAIEVSAQVMSDPMTWLAGLGSLGRVGLATLEKAIPGITKAAEAASAWSGRSAERLSGVPLETLQAYRDPAKRAMMKENFGQEAEIGKEFLEKFRDPDQYLTEVPKLKAIAKDLPPVSSKSATEAMEGALPKPVEGFAPQEIGAYTDVERSAIGKAQSNIDFVRGGAKPEDLAENVSRAGKRATDAEIEAAALGAKASQEAKAATQAARAQQTTQSKAAKAAGVAGKTKKEFLTAADQADRNVTRYGGARDEAGQAAEAALEDARTAAAKARQAAEAARAKMAVGEISKSDYATAKASAESAEGNLELLAVAQKLHSGAPINDVAGELSRQGKSVEQIRDILTRARDRANSIVQPKSDHTFNAYWDKRKRLDSDIDYGKASDNLVDKVNKAGRTEMMKVMEQVAETSNHPEFKELMKSYSHKAQLVDDLKAYIGQTKGANNRKIQQFFDHLLGKNSQHKQDIVAEMDRVMGTETLDKARSAQQAQQIGHDGEAAWFPMHNTGAMGAGQQWLGRIGFLWSSPKIAARATLPAFDNVAKLAKSVGDAIPPKAKDLVDAIEKAGDPAKAAPLVNQLVRVLETESGKVVPFRPRRAADNEDQEDREPALSLRDFVRRPARPDSLLSQLTRGK